MQKEFKYYCHEIPGLIAALERLSKKGFNEVSLTDMGGHLILYGTQAGAMSCTIEQVNANVYVEKVDVENNAE